MANLSKLNKLRQMNQSSRQFIIIFPSFSLIMVAVGTYRGKIIYNTSIVKCLVHFTIQIVSKQLYRDEQED